MKPLLYLALAAYVVAAINSILAFVNKRRVVERISLIALASVVATGALAAGASALTTSGGDHAKPRISRSDGAVSVRHGDKPCKAGEGRRHHVRSSELRY